VRDFKNIDRLYQENLKDFEVFPPNRSWDAIEKQLVNSPKKRRYPIWLKISSIAALLMLFFTVGTIYFIPKNDFTKQFLPTPIDKVDVSEEKEQSKVITTVENTTKKESSTQTAVLSQKDEISEIIEETSEIPEDNLDESTFSKKSLSSYLLTDTSNLPLQSVDDNEVPKDEITKNKFSVATIFAPIYFSAFGDGSGVGDQFKNNSVSGNSSYSYGVKFAYQLNNKFSIQSGVNLINLGYTTNNIYVTPGVTVVGFSNLSSSPVLARSEDLADSKNNSIDSFDEGSLNQVFGYVEIPVEVKYSVVDGKIGVNLVGGFSTLLLNRDEVFVETNNFSQSLGSSNNLRSVNFSGNIGVDVDYLIRKNLYINVTPMFKMHTNTFSRNSGSIQPYYLGVYTGLNYKF
jgi:hypothetical protein